MEAVRALGLPRGSCDGVIHVSRWAINHFGVPVTKCLIRAARGERVPFGSWLQRSQSVMARRV